MEVRRDEIADARECSRRCLEALDGCEDIETRVSLWRAALRYRALAEKKGATAGLEITTAAQRLRAGEDYAGAIW